MACEKDVLDLLDELESEESIAETAAAPAPPPTASTAPPPTAPSIAPLPSARVRFADPSSVVTDQTWGASLLHQQLGADKKKCDTPRPALASLNNNEPAFAEPAARRRRLPLTPHPPSNPPMPTPPATACDGDGSSRWFAARRRQKARQSAKAEAAKRNDERETANAALSEYLETVEEMLRQLEMLGEAEMLECAGRGDALKSIALAEAVLSAA